MDLSRRSLLAGSVAFVGLGALAACGGDNKSGSGSGGGGGAAVIVNGTEPQNALVPTNTNEIGGGRVIQSIFSGLMYYKEDGSAEPDLAESVESDDSKVWTVKLKADQKYSDGSVITAQDFVDSWNYGAAAANGQLLQSFFDPIEGFAEVAEEGSTIKEMKGLKVEDDTTFTVTLVAPQSDFAQRLGYSAYMPMPPSAFKDMKAFGEKPISSGPYKLETWSHDQEIVTVPNEHYNGPRKAKNGGITYRIYLEDDTMYNDLLSDAVDVTDTIPPSRLSTFQDELGERSVNAPGAVFQSITFSPTDKNYQGEAGKLRRQAISRAINRESICKNLFFDSRTPATDFVAPVIEGGGATDIKGAEVLQYDKAKAKELWDKAEAMQKFEGEFTLGYNSDGPHKDWVEAVCNSVKEALGVKATPKPFPEFGKFREQITNRKMPGAFRSGWQADYPSMFNFLGPIYSSAAADGKGSNDADYKNPEFDKLLAEGLSATDTEGALAKFKEAQALLMEDLPAIPLWYQNSLGGFSNVVKDVKYAWDTTPIYYEITKE
ncbi:ABC transporter substrate-binding protein [Helcobacillus sp. ACRRO]|nr:ABC transporter substrate-binding protein [Helcobacillus sp. ACRRO]MCG7427890.1 ABC transporter substrate-binding protein [Helcobacillus sp. ACRRO]